MNFWYPAKLLIEHASGISMDALHVLAGVLLQLLFAELFRIPLRNWRPWLFVLVLALLNEAGDLWVERWPEPAMQYGEGWKDIALTMLLPTILMLRARFRPEVLGERDAVGGKEN